MKDELSNLNRANRIHEQREVQKKQNKKKERLEPRQRHFMPFCIGFVNMGTVCRREKFSEPLNEIE